MRQNIYIILDIDAVDISTTFRTYNYSRRVPMTVVLTAIFPVIGTTTKARSVDKIEGTFGCI